MNQVKSERKYQPPAPTPCVHTAVCQPPSSTHPSFYFYQGSAMKYVPGGTQNLLSVAMAGTQTPQPLPSTIQYDRDAPYCKKHCYVPLMSGAQNLSSVNMNGTQSSQLAAPRPRESPGDKLAGPQQNGPAGNFTACQQHYPSSSLLQGDAGVSIHSAHKPVEDALQKRELRLMKNREAARECRRKKKEYVKCLENRVAVLENQNKTLIEELRALKDIYRHKFEKAAQKSRAKKKKYVENLETSIASLLQENQMLKAELLRLINPSN